MSGKADSSTGDQSRWRRMAPLLLAAAGIIGGMSHFLRDEPSPTESGLTASAGPYIHPSPARPSSPNPRSGPDNHSRQESRDLRRRLASFVIPAPEIRQLPPGEALALLRHQWESLPHAPETSPADAVFIMDPAAEDLIRSRPEPLTVTLEIPDISLLTHLRLLAAQTGLHLHIGPDNVRFLPAKTASPAADVPHTSSISAPRVYFQKALNQPSGETASLSDDGYTIDLHLAPESIEFEGFINYGSPIQTTVVNALGEEETIVLTDSKILQPVFSTLALQPAGSKILTALGLPVSMESGGPGHFWDYPTESLTINAPERLHQVAALVVEALEEKGSAALQLEAWPWQWTDGRPPAPPPGSGKGIPRTTFLLTRAGTVKIPPFPGSLLLPTSENLLSCDFTATAIGASWQVKASVPQTPSGLDSAGLSLNGFHGNQPDYTVTLFPGLWHRLDLAWLSTSPPTQCLHLRARRTALKE